MTIPALWYDPPKSARLTGYSKPKLAKLAAEGKIAAKYDGRGAPIAYAEADVMRLRQARNRLGAERKAKATTMSPESKKKPGLAQMVRRQTQLRERPQDQEVLPWARFPSGNPKKRD